jgi:uncharacterized membrane protein
MDNPLLMIVMRYLHIASAIVAIGGLTFSLVCVRRATDLIPDDHRAAFLDDLRRRFLRLQYIAIAGLLVSGIYNWLLFAGAYKQIGPAGNALIGTKVLLAVILFALVWMRGSRMITSDRVIQMVNLHLGAIVILLAVILRYYRLSLGA